MQQTWKKPVITVLVKGTPEESVLKQCKTPHGLYASPGVTDCEATAHCKLGSDS
jgi:hypothetical protein